VKQSEADMIGAHGGFQLDGNIDQSECQRALPDCGHPLPSVRVDSSDVHESKSNAACGKQVL